MTFHFNFTIVYPHILDVQRSLSNLNGIPCGGGPGAWRFWLLVELLHIYPSRIQGIGFSSSDLFRQDQIQALEAMPRFSLVLYICTLMFMQLFNRKFHFLAAPPRLRMAQGRCLFLNWLKTHHPMAQFKQDIHREIHRTKRRFFMAFMAFRSATDVDSLAEVGPDQGQAWSGTRTTELRRNQIF